MLDKTQAIALNYIRYGDTSIIARLYTEDFGVQSYIINGIRSSKSKGSKIAFFQPLTLLELVVYHKNKQSSLHRISEVKCYHPFKSIPFVVEKSSIALFITEILTKSLREEESNPALYHFIEEAIRYLEQAETGYGAFHIQFLAKFAFFLGIGPENSLDFREQLIETRYSDIPSDPQLQALNALYSQPFGWKVDLPKGARLSLLEQLIFFYKVHLDNLGEIKSLEVLRETLR